jgi:hypothetical protein
MDTKSIPLEVGYVKQIIKKLSYTTQLNPTQKSEKMLGMLGFSQTPNHNMEYLLEKINYPTSLTLPSFEDEIKKMLSSQEVLPKQLD